MNLKPLKEIEPTQVIVKEFWRGWTRVRKIINKDYQPFVGSTGHGIGIE